MEYNSQPEAKNSSTSSVKKSRNSSQNLDWKIKRDLNLENINPVQGVALGDVIEAELTLDDYMYFLRSMSGKFRNSSFLEQGTIEWNLANATFRAAKENGFTSDRFRRQVNDFIVNYKYTINHWQPDDILKLAEQPRLYPRSWVMSKMKDDPHVWEKLAMYEVGGRILYCWRWEDVPLPVFVPKKAKPELSSHQPEAETQDISDEEPSKLFEAVRENLKLKIKIVEMERESREFARRITGLQELVEQLRGNGGGIE